MRRDGPYSSTQCIILLRYLSLVVENQALLIEYTALFVEHRALLQDFVALLVECKGTKKHVYTITGD